MGEGVVVEGLLKNVLFTRFLGSSPYTFSPTFPSLNNKRKGLYKGIKDSHPLSPISWLRFADCAK